VKSPNLSDRSVLEVLTRDRLVALGREFGVSIAQRAKKDEQIRSLVDSGELQIPSLIRILGRDELRAALKAHGLDDSGRARAALAERLLKASGAATTDAPRPIFDGQRLPKETPRKRDIVRVRHRQYLVEDVVPPPNPGDHTLIKLVCLDDDNQGRKLQVLWEIELGARIESPETHGLRIVTKIDEPRHFAAYFHALKWSATTAADGRLFQAPFRAGIKLLNHQLTPLRKALELPRANLFIADDVGLGKTIEAGLVLQELILRQRVDFVLIVCPATLCLQWRDEMERRFGLHFEIYNRAFMARRRQERGFAVNPWTTHARFIISYQTLRRPEYRDPLLQHLGTRARKSLLVLDEAHTAAPATATKYAIDSRVTKVIRDVAPRFENRLFLSATPHNGHSNSFSALLELLDPQRFTRGVSVRGTKELEPVMVRRLKEDLRKLNIEGFPERQVIQIDLRHQNAGWQSRTPDTEWRSISPEKDTPLELILSKKLREYRDLVEPLSGKSGRAKLVFINLQKRLLSSFEAFYRTLQAHARSVRKAEATPSAEASLLTSEEDEYGIDDDAQEQADAEAIETISKALPTPDNQAKQLLQELLSLAEQYRGAPDAKVLALLDWIRANQCPAVKLGGATAKGKNLKWTDRRVILFTEWGDSKRYLWQLLTTAVQGTDRADERILQFHGGMSDEQREEVQLAFNGPPDEYPVRILIATDAAREGVNLQGHCADLFHFDIPWNPARMEQRNGRIDRTLQAAPEVRCHYFFYQDRTEDPVLKKLVRKVDTIHRELGSLSSIILDRLGEVMEQGIDESTGESLDQAEKVEGRKETAEAELESERKELKKLQREIEDAGEIFNRSRKIMDFDPNMLREIVEVGLELSGVGPLTPVNTESGDPRNREYTLPAMSDSWQPTLDALRPPRGRNEPEWEWQKKSPQPVVFKALDRMDSSRVHLHLQHPFVQRILSRFLAQGYSAQDLSRVTVVRNPEDALVRVVAFGRLSLFGPGAVRLHDQLVSVAARWKETKDKGHLEPFADRDERKILDILDRLLQASPSLDGVSAAVRERLRGSASEDFAALWTHIKDEADHLAHDVEGKLKARGAHEADLLKRILEVQREAIKRAIGGAEQLRLEFEPEDRFQKEQFEKDLEYMQGRLEGIDRELETEPKQIRELYEVVLSKLEPVGLVYLWPETRG
jgi:superfamily II DNA/RNA helicase